MVQHVEMGQWHLTHFHLWADVSQFGLGTGNYCINNLLPFCQCKILAFCANITAKQVIDPLVHHVGVMLYLP